MALQDIWSESTAPEASVWGGHSGGDVWGPSSSQPAPLHSEHTGPKAPAPTRAAPPTKSTAPSKDVDRAADRKETAKELKSMFTIVAEPNEEISTEVTQAEFDDIVALISDIRLGSSNIKFDKKSSAAFIKNTTSDLGRITQTDIGRKLLGELATMKDKDGRKNLTTTLQEEELASHAFANALPAESGDKKAMLNGKVRGHGASSSIGYAPGKTATVEGATDKWLPQRSDVVLFHELVHSHHMGKGAFREEEVRGTTLEEYLTVGLGVKNVPESEYSENKYRAARRKLAGTKNALADDKIAGTRRTSYDPHCEAGFELVDSKTEEAACRKI